IRTMTENIVAVENLGVKIGKKTILNDVHLELKKGEAVVIAGRNGSGKTTFLKCLADVIYPDEGHIHYSSNVSREKIGFISDQVSLLENYSLKRGIDFHKDVYSIKDFDDTLLKELNLDLNQKIKNLSAGERILFHLSLILAQKPEILLVDEIIHAIDPYLREQFLEAIIDLLEDNQTTLIMINHTFSEIEKIPERVLIMEKGQFIVDEKSETLGKRLKKVVSESEISEEIPCIFKRELTQLKEYFIYPFDENLKDKFSFDFKDANLNEIIKAFIGGQYVKERNQ
ncbi:MAG: ABC transporter ATP-binding protein, partial [Candidatus Aminicenantes bacterium]|nr:ABC transporter ATP-binding protein [Candidatus Aminicenantes bacterium]